MAMNRHDTMWSSPRTIYIDQNLHDEYIQRIMISIMTEDIQWIKISIIVEMSDIYWNKVTRAEIS